MAIKTLKELANYIKQSSTFVEDAVLDFERARYYITDSAYDNKHLEYYLIADETYNPLTVKSILADSYKYPNARITLFSEDLNMVRACKGFSTQIGDGNFGEANAVVLIG